ncbi:MAG: AAA family ATPase, partial [Ruminococcus sp.]|nr:AAA family ATPase [Ruminococcus sp.]
LKSQAEYLGVKDFKYMNHVIELLQLDPTAKLKRMSKGMKQKTAIVAALMGEKEILVLDEPTTGLDPLMRDAFIDLIREERDKGHTIFMSSHIFEEIEAVCDRVAMIRNGYIIETVSLYDLRHPSKKEFKIEFANGNELQRFLKNTTFHTEKVENGICCIDVPTEKLNIFFRELKVYKVINLQETHLSLQKEFMRAYKEGNKNGNR